MIESSIGVTLKCQFILYFANIHVSMMQFIIFRSLDVALLQLALIISRLQMYHVSCIFHLQYYATLNVKVRI